MERGLELTELKYLVNSNTFCAGGDDLWPFFCVLWIGFLLIHKIELCACVVVEY